MLIKVPAHPEPQEESRTAAPEVEATNSAREARGLRYAEAAEELGTAGASSRVVSSSEHEFTG